MNPILSHTFEAVRKASKYALQCQDRLDSVRIDIKDKQSFVSEVDVNAQEIIVSSILEQLPECKIIAEESSENFDFDDDYEWIAVVDPIDGTHNYLRQIEYCCISVGFIKRNIRNQKDELELGLIYDFNHDVLYHTEKGKGAFCNNRRMRVSQHKNLHFGHVEIGYPLLSKNPDLMDALTQNHTTVRSYGSCALSLAHCASGKLDAIVMGDKIELWDIAAGALMVHEAGGVTLNIPTEKTFSIHQPKLNISGNPSVSAILRQHIKVYE